MTPTAAALLGFVLWQIVLVGMLAFVRTGMVAAGKKKANEFRASGEDLTGFGARLTRAHANCYENIGAVGAVLLYAIATNQSAVTDPLAFIFLGARIVQSLTHMTSTSRPAVFVRFAFYIVQVAILVYWIVALAHLI